MHSNNYLSQDTCDEWDKKMEWHEYTKRETLDAIPMGLTDDNIDFLDPYIEIIASDLL